SVDSTARWASAWAAATSLRKLLKLSCVHLDAKFSLGRAGFGMTGACGEDPRNVCRAVNVPLRRGPSLSNAGMQLAAKTWSTMDLMAERTSWFSSLQRFRAFTVRTKGSPRELHQAVYSRGA